MARGISTWQAERPGPTASHAVPELLHGVIAAQMHRVRGVRVNQVLSDLSILPGVPREQPAA